MPLRFPGRRILIAVDDLDKRDPATVREVLLEARTVLHTDCAFVLTGHPLGILRNLYSTAGGIFDKQMTLEVLDPAEMKLLMRNYLKTGRVEDSPYRDLEPFTVDAAEAIIDRSFGIPRQLNRICSHIMEEAAVLRCKVIDMQALNVCWQRAGKDFRQLMTEDMARLIDLLREQTGQFDPSQVPDEVYHRLGIDSHQALLAKFNAAMSDDFVVGVEISGHTRFLPQPLLDPPPAISPGKPPQTA